MRLRLGSRHRSLPVAWRYIRDEESTTLEPIGEPKPVVASQPIPAEYPITVTGLLDESNSRAELVPVVMS